MVVCKANARVGARCSNRGERAGSARTETKTNNKNKEQRNKTKTKTSNTTKENQNYEIRRERAISITPR